MIGSVSFETAQVEYSDYGYLLTRWTVYLFIAFFTVGAGRSCLTPAQHTTIPLG